MKQTCTHSKQNKHPTAVNRTAHCFIDCSNVGVGRVKAQLVRTYVHALPESGVTASPLMQCGVGCRVQYLCFL